MSNCSLMPCTVPQASNLTSQNVYSAFSQRQTRTPLRCFGFPIIKILRFETCVNAVAPKSFRIFPQVCSQAVDFSFLVLHKMHVQCKVESSLSLCFAIECHAKLLIAVLVHLLTFAFAGVLLRDLCAITSEVTSRALNRWQNPVPVVLLANVQVSELGSRQLDLPGSSSSTYFVS